MEEAVLLRANLAELIPCIIIIILVQIEDDLTHLYGGVEYNPIYEHQP